jgi:hypothetical protein
MENKNINKKLDEIILNQLLLNQKIDKILLNQESIQMSTNNMNTHISFIENVYDTIKNPFYFLLNRVTKIEKIPEKPKELEN